MTPQRTGTVALGLAVTLVVGTLIGMNLSQPAPLNAQGGAQQTGPRYTIVFTEGTNLCVTDNQKNTVYYYTIEPEHEPGADLHLRASLDLSQVGQETLKPRLTKRDKGEKTSK